MLLEIELLKNSNNKKQQQQKQNKTKSKKIIYKKNQNCIKSGLSQFLVLQQKM